MTLQTFIGFAQQAFTALLNLSTTLQTPIRNILTERSGIVGGGVIRIMIKTLDIFGQTWLGNMSVFTFLFSSSSLTFIIIVGLIRWILDILP